MMSHMLFLFTAAALSCCAWPALADEFKLDCQAFSLPTQARSIDSKCGAGGSAAHGSDISKRLQNEAKNKVLGVPLAPSVIDQLAALGAEVNVSFPNAISQKAAEARP